MNAYASRRAPVLHGLHQQPLALRSTEEVRKLRLHGLNREASERPVQYVLDKALRVRRRRCARCRRRWYGRRTNHVWLAEALDDRALGRWWWSLGYTRPRLALHILAVGQLRMNCDGVSAAKDG